MHTQYVYPPSSPSLFSPLFFPFSFPPRARIKMGDLNPPSSFPPGHPEGIVENFVFFSPPFFSGVPSRGHSRWRVPSLFSPFNFPITTLRLGRRRFFFLFLSRAIPPLLLFLFFSHRCWIYTKTTPPLLNTSLASLKMWRDVSFPLFFFFFFPFPRVENAT